MTWQGIPFRLVDGSTIDRLFLTLNSIPKITLDTPTDIRQLMLTVGATFLGGVIPALIAWRTFHVNAKNQKKDRDEQQAFLIGERASQLASQREEREIQVAIAKNNINAHVISTNRQNWIVELRKNISEYLSCYFETLDAQFNYFIDIATFKEIQEKYASAANKSLWQESLSESANKVSASMDIYREVKSKLSASKFNVLLMLNMNEEESIEVKRHFTECAKLFNELSVELESNNFEDIYTKSLNMSDNLLSVTRKILKKEWIRVKAGE